MFVGHCSDEVLVEHFYNFIEGLELDPSLFLSVGMDGPNFNKKFERMLQKEFTGKGIRFSMVYSCPLHTTNNAFGKLLRGLKESGIDLDQFAIDVYTSFSRLN